MQTTVTFPPDLNTDDGFMDKQKETADTLYSSSETK